ncbi:DNA-binding protein Alba [Candidatus Micrarchaeota archaeon]|nr:DNA-binding protein Alba [Candidatus Micrarchaeota archaeon]
MTEEQMAQEEQMPQEQRMPRSKADENTVFIGKKGVMAYVLAVVTQFNNGAPEVAIKARGKVISRAVDVAEIVRSRFLPEAKLKSINIKTEELTSEDGSRSKVSAIEITLTK